MGNMALPLLQTLLTIVILLLVTMTLRIIAISRPRRSRLRPRKSGQPAHLLIVLGSGGHTAEMLSMLRNALHPRPESEAKALDWTTFTHRTWIVSSGDEFSALRAEEFEAEARNVISAPDSSVSSSDKPAFSIISVPRARKIHQPLHTAPFSSLQCLWTCLQLLSSHTQGYPDLIITNGPATATILVWATILLRFFDVRSAQSGGKMKTIYVESWARVKKLSLSGKLLCRIVDRVLVQWPQLDGVGGRGEFLGVLV